MIILETLGLFYFLFNALGGLIAGIWLMILGEWKAIGMGLVFVLGGSFAIGIAMMPGLILALPMVFFEKHKIKIGMYLFGLFSLAYTYFVLSVWSIACLLYFSNMAKESSYTPMLIWGYGVALGPIVFLASKERDNEYTAFAVLTISICLVLSLLKLLIFDTKLNGLPFIFLIGFLVYAVISILRQRELMKEM
jgi:hypothetical protein